MDADGDPDVVVSGPEAAFHMGTQIRIFPNDGAGRFETFLRVTLSQLVPAILAGAAFTFIEAFDNVSVAMFTHSYRARPLPVELLSIVQTDNTPLVAAISGVEILLASAALTIVSSMWGLERFSDSQVKR